MICICDKSECHSCSNIWGIDGAVCLRQWAPRGFLGIFTENLKFVEVNDDTSSCYSGIGEIQPSHLSMSLHSSSAMRIADNVSNYCQCSDDEALVECLTCSPFFDFDTYCLRC
jgi:hypothetical protein